MKMKKIYKKILNSESIDPDYSFGETCRELAHAIKKYFEENDQKILFVFSII